MSEFKYPKGSEWRKWDLHFHTPSSFDYKDKSITNELIIKGLLDNKIKAVAITDHHKMDVGRVENIQRLAKSQQITVFPGIELRTDKGGSESIHIIGIFPEDIDIKTVWTKISGRLNITEKDIQKKGDDKIYVNLEDAAKLIHELGGLVTIHAGSKSNTIENITNSLSYKMAQKEHILKYIDIFEMGKSNDIDDYLLKVIPNISHIKRPPMIICSDNHDIKDYLIKSNLWIKADPTFEGLKQIIYEPDERVYIGEEPPYKIERNKIIKSITVSNSNRWFEDNKPIPLNESLLSIIGGKGTGKTAILDLIAYGTKSYKCYEKDETKSKSFLKKAFRELKGLRIKIEWDDGNSDEKEIGSILEELTKEGKIRYLPQDYVDQLCTEIGKGELEEQIENIIFQKIPSEDKASFADFKSYKEAQLKVINAKKNRVSKQIEEKNLKIYEYKNLIESKGEKEKRRKKVEDEIQKFEKEMEKISKALKDSKTQKILNKLNSFTEKSSGLEKDISELKNKILQIEKMENDVSEFLEDSEGFADKLKTGLKEIGIAQEVINKVGVVLHPKNLQQVFKDKRKEIEEKIRKKREQLTDTNKGVKKLDSEIELEKSKQDKIKEINKSLSELRKKINSLAGGIKKIENTEEKLPQLLNERENIFINYFELIFEERGKLKEIYSPLENILKESGEENEKLFDFTVKFNFNVSSMADEGHELIDLRAEGKFRQSRPEFFREELEKIRFELDFNDKQISENNKNSIKEFLKKVEEFFTKNKRIIVSQLKEKRYTAQDFDNWLYHTKYYNISYSIKFNDIELNNLSPGLKGVALLILFLDLDKEDRRPILIDQPEENLDNRSVYITLMRYFREAKKRRQVIIVTHNPNLVVNTDSEQIIVADFDRALNKQNSRIFYVSGALENTFKDDSANINLEKKGIREHVCEILEGGKEAFEKREKKYGFKTT